MYSESLDLSDVVVFLVAAGVVVPLIQRLRVSPVLGFLFVGILIGPFGLVRFDDSLPWLGHVAITNTDGVRALAELGVVFLLFMIGLELSFERLWSLRRAVFGLGGAQVAVTAAVIAAVAYAFDNPLPAAVVLGACFALSSTAIVVELLAERRRLATPVGRTAFAVLLFQDLAVVPILFMVGAFAARGQGSVVVAFAAALGQGVIAVVVILAIGRIVIRPLFRVVGAAAGREAFVATVLLVIIGTAVATDAAGLSMALGAFLAGLMFAETEYRHEITVDIQPFRGLLLGLFFISVGMGIDMAQVVARPAWLAAAVVGLFAVKGVIFYILARLSGHPPSVALETGLLLGQGGEFAFVVIGLALSLRLLPHDIAQFMLIVTSLTMVATPLVARLAHRLALLVAKLEAEAGQAEAEREAATGGQVIIIGYGRVGQTLAAIFEAQELPTLVIDTDPLQVARVRREGGNIFFGDARRPALLRRLGIDRAAALVVTVNAPETAEQVVEAVHRSWPHLPIYCRAHDRKHAARLLRRGATRVIPETVEASLQLAEMVLLGAGIPEEAARQLVELHRQQEHSELDHKGGDETG